MLTSIRRVARPVAASAMLCLVVAAAPGPARAGGIPATPKDCFGNNINPVTVIYASSGTPKTDGSGGFTIYGTAGDDVILGSPGPDDIFGNDGKDVIHCGDTGDNHVSHWSVTYRPGDYADGGAESPFGIDPVLTGTGCEETLNIP